MVLIKNHSADMDDSMPQIVPSAGFTPPCDYNNFADFDLSLLPGGDLPLSPSTLLYSPSSGTLEEKPKIFTSFYPASPEQEKSDIDLGPDFNKLLPESQPHPPSPNCGIYLDVPSSKNYHANSPIGALSPYSPLLSPNYQDQSIYANSPDASIYQSPYSKSPRDDYQYIKKEYQNSPIYLPGLIQIKEEVYLSPLSSPHQVETPDVFELLQSSLLEKQVKQESTVDFGHLLQAYSPVEPQIVPQASPQDHQLLREVLRDTSFQKKYNIKPFDFVFMSQDIKMEDASQKDLMSCNDRLIEPVLQKAMEQERKAADSTCAALNISGDISKWTSENVFAWMQWTSNELNLPMLEQEQWKIDGQTLVNLTEDEFTKRSPQGGNILYAKLEVWKAAYMEDESMQWQPETTSSNASSGGDISDEEEDEPSPQAADTKPTTSRTTGGSHIHLWQFLKELLASPQVHGSCIRWLDRNSGVFKIEDSVKVAKLWGKRKNRPAMNYDKLSRSIRQYYKKGIMKKTERSQRLVYQFCHPYCL